MSTEHVEDQSFASVAFADLIGGAGTGAAAAARRDAELRGYAAGYAAGARRAERMLEERRTALEAVTRRHREAAAAAEAAREARLEQVLAALDARLEPTLDAARGALLGAAVELAEALLGRELADDELSARAIAARVIAHDEERAVTRVRVHPAEASDVALMLTGRSVDVVGDASLARGDAIAELPDGFLDARITTALARVRRALADEGLATGGGAR
jgi:flagellar assembly protein FliH